MFYSQREKRLWLVSLSIVLAIFLTLFIGSPLAKILENQNVQAGFFLLGMLLVGLALFLNGIMPKSKADIGLLVGLAAIYVMFFLRLGLAERSHLIEYSVLTIFVHKAFEERARFKSFKLHPLLVAFCVVFGISLIDEGLQYVFPLRVFDYYDIIFNFMIISFAIISILLFYLIRKKLKHKD